MRFIEAQCTGLSAIHPQNHPLDSAKTRKKATQTIPLVFISNADPGPAWN
jgi:hypothetical protein